MNHLFKQLKEIVDFVEQSQKTIEDLHEEIDELYTENKQLKEKNFILEQKIRALPVFPL